MAAGDWQVYDSFIREKNNGAQNVTGDSYAIVLLTSSHVLDLADSSYNDISADEVSDGKGYLQGGKDTNLAVGSIANGAIVTGADVSWVASGGTISYRYVALINNDSNGLVAIALADNTPADVTIPDGFEQIIQVSINGIYNEIRA